MPWKRGQSGNPGGWSSAQRRLYKGFLTDVQKRWQEKGGECLDRMIRDHPEDFVKIVAALMPKSLEASITTTEVKTAMTLPDVLKELEAVSERLGYELKPIQLPHFCTVDRIDEKASGPDVEKLEVAQR